MKPGEFGKLREQMIQDVADATGLKASYVRMLPWAQLQLAVLSYVHEAPDGPWNYTHLTEVL